MCGPRIAVSTLFFLNGFVVASWVPYIPAVKSRLQIGDGELGLTLLWMVVGGVIGLPLAGWLVGRFGSRRIAVGTAVGLSLMLPAPVLSPHVTITAMALLVFGAFNGMLDVSMNAQAVDVERRLSRPMMSSFHALFSAGGLAGAASAGLAMAAALPAIVHVVAVSLSAAVVAALTAGSLVTARPTTAVGPVFGRPSRTIVGLGLLAFCGLLAEGAMADWSAVYLRDVLETRSGTAAMGFAACSLAMAIGRFSGDALTRRFGPVHVLRASGTLAAVGLALGLVLHDARAAIIGFGLVGLGIANIVPLVFSAAGGVTGLRPGSALAAVATVGYFGWLAGPPVIGLLAEALGLARALGIVSLACALVALRARTVRALAHGSWTSAPQSSAMLGRLTS